MTVQELIDELMKVEDKTKKIRLDPTKTGLHDKVIDTSLYVWIRTNELKAN